MVFRWKVCTGEVWWIFGAGKARESSLLLCWQSRLDGAMWIWAKIRVDCCKDRYLSRRQGVTVAVDLRAELFLISRNANGKLDWILAFYADFGLYNRDALAIFLIIDIGGWSAERRSLKPISLGIFATRRYYVLMSTYVLKNTIHSRLKACQRSRNY